MKRKAMRGANPWKPRPGVWTNRHIVDPRLAATVAPTGTTIDDVIEFLRAEAKLESGTPIGYDILLVARHLEIRRDVKSGS
jgi:hypothetical protein